MSKLTHVFAAAIGAVAAFLMTPAGIALLHQYPHIAPLVMGLVSIFGVYRNPGNQPPIVQ